MTRQKNKGTDTLPFKDMLTLLMRERNLTIKEISSLAEVSPSVVQNWLIGRNPHDLRAIDRLCSKLGVSFKKMLLGVNDIMDAPSTISELYDKVDVFDGLCSVQIKKLIPKRNGDDDK